VVTKEYCFVYLLSFKEDPALRFLFKSTRTRKILWTNQN